MNVAFQFSFIRAFKGARYVGRYLGSTKSSIQQNCSLGVSQKLNSIVFYDNMSGVQQHVKKMGGRGGVSTTSEGHFQTCEIPHPIVNWDGLSNITDYIGKVLDIYSIYIYMRHIRKHFKRKLRHKIRKLREYKILKGAHYQKGHFKHFSRKRGYGNISQCPPHPRFLHPCYM